MEVTIKLKSGITYKVPETAVDNIYRMFDGKIQDVIYPEPDVTPFKPTQKAIESKIEEPKKEEVVINKPARSRTRKTNKK